MSLEYLLDVAIQFEQQTDRVTKLERHQQCAAQAEPTPTPPAAATLYADTNHLVKHFDTREYTHIQAAPFHPFLLPPTGAMFGLDPKKAAEAGGYLAPFLLSHKAEAARRRQVAIERRNAKRNIVPRHAASEAAAAVCIDRNKTKNRISAASYRENRDKRVHFIEHEIQLLQKEHPGLQSKDWVPMKKSKSAIRDGESKEEYRKRTNRESAADSRYQQQQKLQYLTRELARLRAVVHVGDAAKRRSCH
ncbi:hypothetical protein SPRG_08123 [Saprolegnia parasitica CBS 223.65]|uniref:BZIP domain-containing protein n=1 Tax=Saprolegnia parasitica (strain CBS 223.65) TaxID=695850 RepID=A0A067CJ45_SAPPC|nr:hypothetical protein SPRG_08123 [Saprolegnia parasitica CBS 223.65]KDO26832.1 hypothetical protein SPRG_08123 [Saprolegnia parasitica CBS 223.65]|eukprot:XP_012202478.1 hypothetical protein SPRG_08123 [Saprolegnia parasitica CBS 223.65]